MIPARKLCPSNDETNLQHQQPMIKPIVNTNPVRTNTDVDDNLPPPIPRRHISPYQSSIAYQSSPSLYGGYGMNPYSMGQNFPLGAGYGNPMIPSAAGVFSNDSVLQGVESVSRSAFESVGGVVQTLSSVTMMLQSTLWALQNSVSAITNVAQQCTHLRNYMISSCLSVIRIVKYYIQKLSALFGVGSVVGTTLSSADRSNADIAFSEAVNEAVGGSANNNKHGIVVFFAIVLGTPYFLWRLWQSIISHSESVNNWREGVGEHYSAEVKFTYNAVNRDELSITTGDIIRVAPKQNQPQIQGWVLASKGDKQGLVPGNYIKILSKNNVDGSNIRMNQKIEEVKEDGGEVLN